MLAIQSVCSYCNQQYQHTKSIPFIICKQSHICCSLCFPKLKAKFKFCLQCQSQSHINSLYLIQPKKLADFIKPPLEIKKINHQHKEQSEQFNVKSNDQRKIKLSMTKVQQIQEQQNNNQNKNKSMGQKHSNFEKIKNFEMKLSPNKKNNKKPFELEIEVIYKNGYPTNQAKVTVIIGESCELIMNKLKSISNLRQLRIHWTAFVKKSWIMETIRSLPDITSLHFDNTSNEFDAECAMKVSEFLPNLTELYYGFDVDSGIEYFSRSPYFRQGKNYHRQIPLQPQCILKLTQDLPNLSNIWINGNEEISIGILKKQWSHLAIGKKQYQQLTEASWQTIKSLRKLQSFSLIKIDVKNELISYIISQNSQYLKSIMFDYCKGVSESGICNLMHCKKLKSLYLLLPNNFVSSSTVTGTFLYKLPQLKHLYLYNCTAISVQHMRIALKQMTKLEYLTISYNYCVDDTVMEQVVNIRNLRYLNLYWCRKITDVSFKMIKKLQKVTTLHIGYNRITNECVLELVNSMSKISKIALCFLSITEKQLEYVGLSLPFLTHVDVRGCKLLSSDELFTDPKIFPELRYVDLSYSGIKAKHLKKTPRIGVIG